MDNILKFTYRNYEGIEKNFSVKLIKETTSNFSGVDLEAGRYKTFKKAHVINYLDNTNELLESTLSYDPSPVRLRSHIGNPKNYNYETNTDDLLEVCFTGFKKADKERLTTLAKDNALFVVQDTTVNLGILVCGYNAGPAKIERAMKRSYKVEIMDEDAFLHFIKTGEV